MIKRELFPELKEHLSKKEISFIVGPRQAGKTTLMLLLKEYLEKKGERTVFLNLDIESDKQFFASQTALIKKIELEIGGERGFVFIDEIQRKENAGIFLKGIYDMHLPYKFIVSGSGSVELKEEIHESLVGRKRIFELSTLSFKEFVNFRTDYKYENRILDFLSIDRESAANLLDDYLNFGGYPRVVLENLLKEKRKIINEIYQSYLEKDITYLLKIRKSEDFSYLVKVSAAQIGQLFNTSEVSRTLGISQKTIKNYIWYLQKTFILQKVTPYYKNIRKEITKTPIFYFHDLGLRNYAIGVFGNLNNPHEKGLVFENFVFNILKGRFLEGPTLIHFWRTKDGAEVDFVIDIGRTQIPIETKFRHLKEPEMTRALRNFINRYRPQKVYIVNLSLERTLSMNMTKIYFIPFCRLYEIDR
ncbi:MAG: ATPase [bacterium (Candidatus Stahlbacteria) CG08_land_8_20_14_0_20_40_26]|nr:MAG: ATPase [bacterium (Candidatus Stahlbacteria) CG23_combo_of_CG06-09_8_20_14_all_40_9]PIS25457.1 MAG: ATPase [bacterium (Candidatus Stahlbacteria) CG08_land_8_20_14_0_20_40_26]